MSLTSRTIIHATILITFLLTALIPTPLLAYMTEPQPMAAGQPDGAVSDDVTVALAYFDPVKGAWKRHSIPLIHSNFRTSSGGSISELQFRTLMSNVTQIRISTEYHHGPDVGSLDSISIGTSYSEEFTTGAGGWTVRNDGTLKWVRTGGDPGGYAQVDDWTTGQLNWLVAPANWSGDWRHLIGKTLSLSSNTDESIDHRGRVEIVSEPTGAEKRLVLEPDEWTIQPGDSTAVHVTATPKPDVETSVSYKSSNPSCISVKWVTSKIIKGGDSTFVIIKAEPSSGNGCSAVIEAKADGYISSRVTLVNFPVQQGNIILNADGPGVKVNGQAVDMGGSVKVGDASRIESSVDGAVSIDLQCMERLHTLLIFVIEDRATTSWPSTFTSFYIFVHPKWQQFVEEVCGEQSVSVAKGITPTTDAHLQFTLTDGGFLFGSQSDKLALEIETPNGVCQLSGKKRALVVYDSDIDASLIHAVDGSVKVIPENSSIQAFTLAEGDGVLLTDSAVEIVKPAQSIYLPLCVSNAE